MYIDDAGGAAIGANIGKQMADFAAGAKSGAFAVNEAGGDALLKAIRDMATWYNTEKARLIILDQEPALGSSTGAATMKPHSQSVANDDRGFLTQLKAFGDSLVAAEEAIMKAMENYRNTEGSNTSKFGE